jgi:hypothetical protein
MDWATHTTSYGRLMASILTNERQHIDIGFITPNPTIAGVIYRAIYCTFGISKAAAL